MTVLATSGKMLASCGEIAAVKGVFILLNCEQLLHGGNMEVVKVTHSDLLVVYVFVTPSTFTLVLTIGRHLPQ